nr:hypothetical protein [Tanacetum cinerariifolium]
MKSKKMKLSCEWKLYTDRAASFDGSCAGLMLRDPEGKKYTDALRFGFETMNNEAEYKALLAGLQIAQDMDIADALRKMASMTFEHLTKEVLVEVLSKRSIKGKEIMQVETKEEVSWMTYIHEYLVSGLLPEDPKESRKTRVKAPQYKLIRRSLYRRSFYTPWLCFIAPSQTDNIVKEIHKGSYGFNAESRSMVVIITKQAYYCPSMHRDAVKVIQDCEKYKEQSVIRKTAKKDAITARNGWPGRTKEVTKRKESKEVASIEEAYYKNKLRRYHDERSSHSTYKIRDFVLLLQNDTRNPHVWQGPHMISKVREGELYKITDASDHSLTQMAKGTSLRKFYM